VGDTLFKLLSSNTGELRCRAELLCERLGDDERLKAARFAAWNGELFIQENDHDDEGDDDMRRYQSSRAFSFDNFLCFVE
jgi:hypothetical protein